MANVPQPLPNESAPDFTGRSKPIEQPKATPAPSLESLFSSIGNTLKGIATGADTLIKENIKDGLYKDIDTQRGNFTSELSQFSKDAGGPGQSGRTPSTANPGGGGEDGEDDVPDEVTGIGDQVANLKSAREGGKISPTQYWLAIDNIAKDYRSRYAGHRDFIDQTISSITGHNPANAYYSSIMSDLNYAMRGGNSKVDPDVRNATNAVQKLVNDGGVPPGKEKEMFDLAKSDPQKANAWVNSVRGPEWKFKMSQWENGVNDKDLENNARSARVAATDYANGRVWADFESNLILGGETLQSVEKKMYDMASDPKKANPQAAETLGMKYAMLVEMSKKGMINWLNTTKNASGTTIAQAMAGKSGDSEKLVNDFVKERYAKADEMVKNLVADKPSIAALQASFLKGQATNDKFNVLTSEDPYTTHLRILDFLSPYPKDAQDYLKSMLGKNYEGANVNVTNWARNTFGMFMTGRSQGKLVSVDEAIKKARDSGITDPKLYNDFAKFGEKILDPNLSHDTKVNIAASMFNPANFGFLSNFNEDKVVVGDDGVYRMAPGKYSVWQTYTTPAFAAEIKKLSAENPEVGKWYRDWLQQGFGSDVFGPQIRKMAQVMADPRVELTYNNVSNQFNTPEQADGDFWTRVGARTQRKSGVIDDTTEAVRLMNLGLRGMANEAETRGITDPAQMQGYLLGQLKALGVIPQDARIRPDGKTIADKMINAFLTTAKAFSPVQGGDKKKNK